MRFYARISFCETFAPKQKLTIFANEQERLSTSSNKILSSAKKHTAFTEIRRYETFARTKNLNVFSKTEQF